MDKVKTITTTMDEPTVISPKPKRKTKKMIIDAETMAELPAKRVNDNGEVNLDNIPVKRKKYYAEIAKSLNEKDMTSIATYGSDLQRAMDTYSNDFLTQQMTSKSNVESAQLIANLLGELQEIDIDELEAPGRLKRFLRRVPILKKMIVSVEQIKSKYNTIQKNIDGIVKKLEATRAIAIRDNNLLQKQFENNCDYVDQLEDLIVAGKIKSKELEATIDKMTTDGNCEDYEISDVQEYKNALDKRLTDLIMLRYAFKQSLGQIRIIQRTNIMDANNTESQITMTIPLWRNQLSLAVALSNQKKSIEVKSKVTEANNNILKKNAEMMKAQAIEVAKQNQQTVIDIEVLKKITSDFIATVEGVQKAQQEGAAKRQAAEAELMRLEKQMSTAITGIQESTKRVISRELNSSSDERDVLGPAN